MNSTTDETKNLLRLVFIMILSILFIVAGNVLFALINPELGNVSLYDHLFPGRERFPFGENSNEAYNLSLDNINAMFESHKVESIQPDAEYSIFIIGDSSVWGTLLKPEETLAGILNAKGLEESKTNLPVRVYNLGYPTISLMKDLMILEESLDYKPDMIIWMVTLEAMPWEKQLTSPIVSNNSARVRQLVEDLDLSEDVSVDALENDNFYGKTIFGRRREIADIIRLQTYGFLWASTGIDQYYPDRYTPAQIDLDPDYVYYGLSAENFSSEDLAFSVFGAGKRLCSEQGKTDLVIVNEPILISPGMNSDIRYNFYYPRWVYDQYRVLLHEYAEYNEIELWDFWNLVSADEFTNSAIHLSPRGEQFLAEEILQYLHATKIISEAK